MNATQIVRESEQFPQVERVNENQVNFYFDHDERPYGEGVQYSAVMVGVETQSDDIEEIKALALPAIKEYVIAQIDAYDKSDSVNQFIISGEQMWLTVEEREQIATQISANEAVGRDEMTKWFGGVQFTYSIALWKQMLVALEVYAGDALNVTEGHKSKVSAMRKADRVIEYDFTAGYPNVIDFDSLFAAQ